MSNLADKQIDAPAPASPGVPRTRDPEIGTLPLVFDPEGLSKEIGRLRLYAELGELPKVVGIHEMRRNFKPHCTCEIILDTGNGCRRLIGKVYATDRQDVYEYMETLEQAGFHPGAEFSIPHPVAYVPSLRLLLQERVEGTSAQDIFKRGDRRHCAEAAERCARWLARFHATAPPTGRVSGVEKFIRSAERKCRLISEGGGPLAAKCEEVLGRLKAAAPSPGAVSICAGHGDFCDLQIIFAQGRTVVVDWDDHDLADPARDIAHFIVSLERLAGKNFRSLRALDDTAEMFRRTYMASGGHPSAMVNLPFYKAVFWLKGRKNAIQTKAPGWRKSAELMLDESLRSLTCLRGGEARPPTLEVGCHA